ncbi:hypothetical protein, partial [Klebsiella pneumoniae]|uniref:hypothetical protein n=1 Tax=Klebsiella pneumoniae TaxID=573 RepID=UPI0020735AE8|nr:hypothetical protein [Klebsiella pneumoniae]MCM6151902.1 hypothetical protein [Klebsiella pneumoniae]MCM6198437.1 hypothetical protein [Klebsiella pneumoniae]MCM6401783.1 hypothetical protein [Klebsiella pneumoniae]MCM6416752.1 hypothetical protein [Klebsiella pneumoniae]
PVSHKKSPPAAGKVYTQLLQDDSGSFFVNVVIQLCSTVIMQATGFIHRAAERIRTIACTPVMPITGNFIRFLITAFFQHNKGSRFTGQQFETKT